MKNKFKIVFIPIFLVIIVTLNACKSQPETAATTTPSTLSAMLSEITGKVEIKQSTQDAFTPAAVDSFLDANGQLQTGDDGRVRLDLSTGTILRVPPTSLFTLTLNEPTNGSLKTRLELAFGKLFIILNGGSMEVETPTGTAAVRGSYMSVSYNSANGETRITCLEGHCSLANASGSVEITAGQTAVITGIGQPPQIGEMSDQDIQDWLDNNPDAKLVVAALTVEPVSTETPPPTNAPPTEIIPTIMVPPTLADIAPVITNPNEDKKKPLLVPIVEINNFSPTSSVVGEPLNFYIGVSPSSSGPAPTGTVKVLANGNPICAASIDEEGFAVCTGGIPATGSFDLVTKYFGDANYMSAQSATWSGYIVSKASTTTTITNHAPNPSQVGAATTFTATVDVIAPGAGTPKGSVTFTDGTDGCTDTAAPWACSITFTNIGSRLVTAIYSGDANFDNIESNSISHDVLASADTEFRNISGPISAMIANAGQCNQPYSVDVLDVNGIGEVKMEYSINDNTFSSASSVFLTNSSGNTWQGSVNAAASYPDTVYWRFISADNDSNQIFFGGSTPYTNGYTGGAVNAYYFDLATGVTCP